MQPEAPGSAEENHSPTSAGTLVGSLAAMLLASGLGAPLSIIGNGAGRQPQRIISEKRHSLSVAGWLDHPFRGDCLELHVLLPELVLADEKIVNPCES